MNPSDADRQIKQMVNFILQEAQERANEIRIKTEHDFNLEKQMLVHNAKLKIQEEYARKEKDREIQKRIARSAEIGVSRRNKMIAREKLLQTLISDAKQQCSKTSKDAVKYKKLLQDLITQGLIKLYESDVVVRCREVDIPLVEGILEAARNAYIETMKKEVGLTVDVKLTIAKDPALLLPSNSSGGIILAGYGGKIICDNTLDTRLEQINYELQPKIRSSLFPIIST